mmetsp:Transcript_5553/g.6401  ORF Transcript_5553/g.6401 Transcript_5553/m.6401 type:complete len:332 (+) Transcript_5553:153-1148(+)|eukprot:CAMPEP_0204848482 /NCGR_PEP_ID=MMETSP1347-20130617/4253_1 /ASSEMBLY_ACC=CAM_ASM_000690 /TAXON_ID=215587 /ORGANISM="Aplanochytrium stocchinoi, Strain GSBS06" /LENGTH=331 /DNA_ID=CAMNT_0051990073 /DNA_START=92 /DNA_END=1087 /DNA_ORIENTATION=+
MCAKWCPWGVDKPDDDEEGNFSAFSMELLKKQNAETSAAIIQLLNTNPEFLSISENQTKMIMQRDNEDGEKLAAGIQIGIDRGALPTIEPVPYKEINVLGKTPDEIADEIISDVGEAVNTGAVIVLVGLSGTGKGTTVTKLSEKLPNTVTWSNGNIFRSITLLATSWCENNGMEQFDANAALTSENIADYLSMLSFDEFPDRGFDIKIEGLGISAFVKDIQNTDLKGPKVSKNIPTVAKQIQGEAVGFAAAAIEKMREAGMNVLLEGREQTVNYVSSPFRYSLTLSDSSIIGKRRVAQMLGATAFQKLQEEEEEVTPTAILETLNSCLSEL